MRVIYLQGAGSGFVEGPVTPLGARNLLSDPEQKKKNEIILFISIDDNR